MNSFFKMTRPCAAALILCGALASTSVLAQAQNTTTCIGYCGTPTPTFTVGVSGSGYVAGANQAVFGLGGTGTSNSSTQDFMRLELNLTGTGGPSGLCPGGCPANNLTANLSAGVLTTGLATHTFSGAGGRDPIMASTSSASSGALQLTGQGTWSTLSTAPIAQPAGR